MDFYSSGKFLISGEYLVLKGALALAIPLKFGQTLSVKAVDNSNLLIWTSFSMDKKWFEAEFSLPKFSIEKSSDIEKALFLQKVLKNAHTLNRSVIGSSKGYKVTTTADFDINWGMGSSSTLISNISYWFKINPFELHFQVSKGSGYDIACARTSSPILYRLKNRQSQIIEVPFKPAFSKKLHFVYLGKKQNTETNIAQFGEKLKSKQKEIKQITEITKNLISASSLDNFRLLLDEHETIMAEVLELPTVKESLFPDFPGSVKSLGAWGGDFVLMACEESDNDFKTYLKSNKLNICFNYDEVVLPLINYTPDNKNIKNINNTFAP